MWEVDTKELGGGWPAGKLVVVTPDLPVVEIQRVQIKDGDTIVLMRDDCLPDAAIKSILDSAKRIFPNNKCLLLEEGMKMGVLSPTGEN